MASTSLWDRVANLTKRPGGGGLSGITEDRTKPAAQKPKRLNPVLLTFAWVGDGEMDQLWVWLECHDMAITMHVMTNLQDGWARTLLSAAWTEC